MRRLPLAVGLPLLLSALGIAIAPLAASAQRPQEPRPVFRAGVELVVLNLSVVDDDGEPLTGLVVEDFRVFEDGQRQDITLFATSEDTPLDVALVLDVSASIARNAPTIREDAKAFLQALGPRDCVYLLPFRDVVGAGVWAAPHALSDLIDQVELSGGTALYDAVGKALANVDRTKYENLPGERAAVIGEYDREFCGVALPPPNPSRPGSVRRTAVVVLSDGGDEHSVATYADTLIGVWSHPVPVFSVAIGDALRPRRRGVASPFLSIPAAYRRALAYSRALEHRLGQLAHITGGQLILGKGRGTVRESFEEVVTMLRSSYLVGYRPPQDDGSSVLSWHDIDVDVSARSADVRTRPGYYRNLADTAGAARIVRQSPALIRQRQPEEALRQLDLALQLDSSYLLIYLQRARVLRDLGRDAEARESLERVLYLHPGLGAAHALLAQVAYLLGDTDRSWYHAIRASQDAVDNGDLMRELIALTGAPEGLEQELGAPRVFVDIAPTPDELGQSALLELLRALRAEFSEAPDVGLISLSSNANFVVYLEVEKIEGSPRKLEGKLLVSATPYQTIHDEGIKIDDIDDPEAVTRGMSRAVTKVREWIVKRQAEQQ